MHFKLLKCINRYGNVLLSGLREEPDMIDLQDIKAKVEKLKQEIEESAVNSAQYTFKLLLPIIEQLEKEIVVSGLEKDELRKENIKLNRQNRHLEDQLILSQRPRVN